MAGVFEQKQAGARTSEPLILERAMTNRLLKLVEEAHLKKDIPQFLVGDTVDVATRIIEGEKERIQVFGGTVIARRGAGINATFTVRRIVNNEGVERIYPLHSPFIAKVTVKRSGENRRAKLYYLRHRVGKAVRLVEKRKAGKATVAAGAAPASSPEAVESAV
jgi:large subunit ribosomal protein L19